jgi:16S rRNA (cytosine967-C5)-methyltransferase
MMPSPPISRPPSARQLALDVLLACRDRDGFIQDVLNQHLSTSSLAGADRRLAAQLAYGVLRRRATLDAFLKPLIARPLGPGNEAVYEALRLGVFQLALLKQIPPHAAINETVNLVGNPRQRGFVNGVLRNVARVLTDETVAGPAANALPLESGEYRRLAQAVLPEPDTHPVEYLAAAFALPAWLARRWLQRWSWDECLQVGFWFARTPPLWLRVNRLKTDRATMLAALEAAGVKAEPGEHPMTIRLAETMPVRNLPGYADGWFAVQDLSALAVADALAPEPGSTVLDLCAAPGGKTTHLAELMGNQGRIVACDISEPRLQTLTALAKRLEIGIIETCLLDPRQNQEPPLGPFDAVLADVPCSNTGVLGRRPEARWRLGESDLMELVRLQTKLLLWAAERVKPGGKLVYSTCSIEPQENQQVVRNVLKAMRFLALKAEKEQRPGAPADGGYWALLRREL